MISKANLKVNRYRRVFKNSLGKKVYICYKRKKDMPFHVNGQIIKVRKSSIRLLIDDELSISIGFRNIKETLFHKYPLILKCRLYFNVHKL